MNIMKIRAILYYTNLSNIWHLSVSFAKEPRLPFAISDVAMGDVLHGQWFIDERGKRHRPPVLCNDLIFSNRVFIRFTDTSINGNPLCIFEVFLDFSQSLKTHQEYVLTLK